MNNNGSIHIPPGIRSAFISGNLQKGVYKSEGVCVWACVHVCTLICRLRNHGFDPLWSGKLHCIFWTELKSRLVSSGREVFWDEKRLPQAPEDLRALLVLKVSSRPSEAQDLPSHIWEVLSGLAPWFHYLYLYPQGRGGSPQEGIPTDNEVQLYIFTLYPNT